MKVLLALAASPLTELHLPKTLDPKSLRHVLTDIPEFRKGLVKWDIEFDHQNEGKPHENARVTMSTEIGEAFLQFFLAGDLWEYEGESVINGELTEYEGQTAHNSVQAIARKVRTLAKALL